MKSKNALCGLAMAVVLQLGMLAGSAQTNIYLFSGSETNIALPPGTYIITAYGAAGGDGGYGGGGGSIIGSSAIAKLAEVSGIASPDDYYGNGEIIITALPPPLTIIADGANVVLTWPTADTGFTTSGYNVESTPSLVPPVAWQTNSAPPIVIGGHDVIISPIAGPQIALHAQTYSIDWFKIAGGGASTGGTYQVTGTIGQPDASTAMTGGGYSLTGGFWSLFAVQMSGAPFLTITHSGNQAIVSWPASVTGWTLQTNNNIAKASWGNYAGFVINNSVTNSPPTGNLYFRLSHP